MDLEFAESDSIQRSKPKLAMVNQKGEIDATCCLFDTQSEKIYQG